MKILKLLFPAAVFLIIFPTGLYAQNLNTSIPDTVRLLMMEEKYDESLKMLDSVLAYDSTNVNAYYYQSLCYQALSNYQKASAALTKALIYKSNDIKMMVSLGNDLLASGRLTRAEDVLAKAFMLDSTNNQVLISYGKVLMQKHDWLNAVKVYNRLIQFDSTNSFFYVQAGKCSILLNDIEDAIIDFQVAHLLNPKNEKTIMELSSLYIAQKKFISAMRIVDDGLAVYPLSTIFWTRKGDIYLGMEKYRYAIGCYKNSLQHGDSSVTNYKNCGLCYYFTGKYDSSISFLTKAIHLNKKDPTSFFYLGASFKELKNYDEAIKNLFAALKFLKSDYISEVYTQLASSYYSIKNYKESLDFYKDALRENPKKYVLNFYLATVYEHYYKDKSIAMRYYKKFLADSVKADKKLVAYAKDRIDIMTEKNFMDSNK